MRKKTKEKRQSNETKDGSGAIKELEVDNKRETAKTRDVDDDTTQPQDH